MDKIDIAPIIRSVAADPDRWEYNYDFGKEAYQHKFIAIRIYITGSERKFLRWCSRRFIVRTDKFGSIRTTFWQSVHLYTAFREWREAKEHQVITDLNKDLKEKLKPPTPPMDDTRSYLETITETK